MKTIVADVRYAELRDAEALSNIHETAWRGTYGGLIPHRALNGMIARRGPDWWRRALGGRAAILTLDYDGRTAGYATIGRNRTSALAAEGEIYELYLLPEFQGVGFGRHLFEAARSVLAARKLKGLAVWALEDNTRAMDFYQALGGADVAAGTEAFDGVILSKVAFVWS